MSHVVVFGTVLAGGVWWTRKLPEGWRRRCAGRGYQAVSAYWIRERGDGEAWKSALLRGRLRAGCCPLCGEAGAVDACGGFTCPVHGPYAACLDPGAGPVAEDPEAFLAEERPGDPEWAPTDTGWRFSQAKAPAAPGWPRIVCVGARVRAHKPQTGIAAAGAVWVPSMDAYDGALLTVVEIAANAVRCQSDNARAQSWWYDPAWLERAG